MQQVIIWTNVTQVLWRQMASLDLNFNDGNELILIHEKLAFFNSNPTLFIFSKQQSDKNT